MTDKQLLQSRREGITDQIDFYGRKLYDTGRLSAKQIEHVKELAGQISVFADAQDWYNETQDIINEATTRLLMPNVHFIG